MAADQYAAALRPLSAATLVGPTDITAHRRLASCLAALQRWDEAISLLEDCRQRFPLDPAFRAQLGAVLLEMGRLDAAVHELAGVADFPGGDPRWLRWYTDALIRSGQRQQALEAVRRLVARCPGDARVLRTAAKVHLDYGLHDEATGYLLEGQRLSPSPEGALLLVQALTAAGRGPEALEVAEATVAAAPDHASSHGALAHVLLDAGLIDRARSAAHTALGLEPDKLRWHVLLAHCYDASLDFNRSREILLDQARRHDRDPETLRIIAGYFADTGDVLQGLELAERLVEVSPDVQSFVILGDYLQRLKRDDDSLAALQRAVELYPNDAGATATMGSILARHHRVPEAIEHLEAALSLRPDRGKWRLKVARLLLDLGRTEQAQKHLEKLLRDNPKDATGREQYARALLLGRRAEEAEAYVDHAAAEPNSAHVAFRHYLEAGYDERAFTYLSERHRRILADVLASRAVR